MRNGDDMDIVEIEYGTKRERFRGGGVLRWLADLRAIRRSSSQVRVQPCRGTFCDKQHSRQTSSCAGSEIGGCFHAVGSRAALLRYARSGRTARFGIGFIKAWPGAHAFLEGHMLMLDGTEASRPPAFFGSVQADGLVAFVKQADAVCGAENGWRFVRRNSCLCDC